MTFLRRLFHRPRREYHRNGRVYRFSETAEGCTVLTIEEE